MKKITSIRFVISFILIPLGALALANTGSIHRLLENFRDEPANADTNEHQNGELISELLTISSQVNMQSDSLYIKGLFTAIDNEDPDNAIVNVPYQILRRGDLVYSRFGTTEIINSAELFLLVDHAAKRMIVQPPQIPGNSDFPTPVISLSEFIKDENYSIGKRIENGYTTISVTNPKHIACTEYTIAYDTESKLLRRIYLIIPDLADNLDTKKNKSIALKIESTNGEGQESLLGTVRFIRMDAGLWKASPQFSDYEITGQ